MWVLFAVGVSVGLCIGVACMATSVLVDTYLEELKKNK